MTNKKEKKKEKYQLCRRSFLATRNRFLWKMPNVHTLSLPTSLLLVLSFFSVRFVLYSSFSSSFLPLYGWNECPPEDSLAPVSEPVVWSVYVFKKPSQTKFSIVPSLWLLCFGPCLHFTLVIIELFLCPMCPFHGNISLCVCLSLSLSLSLCMLQN